jgi:putative ABC transport system ATP-binding protein
VREIVSEMEGAPVFFHDPDLYNPTATVLDNILLGRVSSSAVDGREKVLAAVQDLIARTGLSSGLLDVGLDFEMGNGGRRLSETQRQKLHLARALIKKPDIIVFNEVLGALDVASRQATMRRILELPLLDEEDWKPGILAVLLDDELAGLFDRVLVYRNGTLVDEEPDEIAIGASDEADGVADKKRTDDDAHAE